MGIPAAGIGTAPEEMEVDNNAGNCSVDSAEMGADGGALLRLGCCSYTAGPTVLVDGSSLGCDRLSVRGNSLTAAPEGSRESSRIV